MVLPYCHIAIFHKKLSEVGSERSVRAPLSRYWRRRKKVPTSTSREEKTKWKGGVTIGSYGPRARKDRIEVLSPHEPEEGTFYKFKSW